MAEQSEPSSLEKSLDLLAARSSILVPAAILLGAAVLGLLRGPGAAVLTVAAGLLLGGIAGLWSSLRVLAGDAPLTLHEAIDLGAPTDQQERKEKVLLAIKEIQSEHALGKLSDEDFKEISARYRAQAKQLLREMDDDLAPARQQAEALLAARLAGQPDEEDEEEDEAPKKKKKAKKAAAKKPTADKPEAAKADAEKADAEGLDALVAGASPPAPLPASGEGSASSGKTALRLAPFQRCAGCRGLTPGPSPGLGRGERLQARKPPCGSHRRPPCRLHRPPARSSRPVPLCLPSPEAGRGAGGEASERTTPAPPPLSRGRERGRG